MITNREKLLIAYALGVGLEVTLTEAQLNGVFDSPKALQAVVKKIFDDARHGKSLEQCASEIKW